MGDDLISHPKLVDVAWRVEPPTKTNANPAVVVDLQVRASFARAFKTDVP